MGASAVLVFGVLCTLESLPDAVRVRSCSDPEMSWTIPAASDGVAVKGAPGGFRDGAVVDIALDAGGSTWMALSDRRDGQSEPLGLARQDTPGGRVHRFRGADAGPCGFEVRDLMLRGDTLWVATDHAISRLRLSSDEWDEWTHYALLSDRSALEETACAGVLTAVAEAATAPGGETVERRLAAFRPRFWKRHARRAARAGSGTTPASASPRRRNEQALGDARRAGTGSRADVHPGSGGRP